MNGGWSVGTLAGVPFLILLLITGLGIGFWLRKAESRSDRELGALWLVGTPVVILIVALWAFWPLSKEYHYWTPVSGTVEAVDRRQVVDGEGMSEKIVVRFKDNDQLYGIEDTRGALLKEGDEASLLCKRAHQWGPSADGYDCRWGK